MIPEKEKFYTDRQTITSILALIDVIRNTIAEIREFVLYRRYCNKYVYYIVLYPIERNKTTHDRKNYQKCAASASKFAADSQSKLGKIKTANQGQFSIESCNENNSNIKAKARCV